MDWRPGWPAVTGQGTGRISWRDSGSGQAQGVNAHQPVAFKAQDIAHAVGRAVEPFFDGHFGTPAGAQGVADPVTVNRLATFAQDFKSAVAGADQLAAASEAVGRRRYRGQPEQHYKGGVLHNTSRCRGVMTVSVSAVAFSSTSSRYRRSTSTPPCSTK